MCSGRGAIASLRKGGMLRPYTGGWSSVSRRRLTCWRGPRWRTARRATIARGGRAEAVRNARAGRHAQFPQVCSPAMAARGARSTGRHCRECARHRAIARALDSAGTSLDGGCRCRRTGGATLRPDDGRVATNAADAPPPDLVRMGDPRGSTGSPRTDFVGYRIGAPSGASFPTCCGARSPRRTGAQAFGASRARAPAVRGADTDDQRHGSLGWV